MRAAAQFDRFQRLLWLVLGALARRGYAVQPADASDLIQDFYVDAWEAVNRNYEASRGPFDPYVYGAFYRFARRRIIQMENWRRRLVDLSYADHLADTLDIERRVDLSSQNRRMETAISRLPSDQQFLLHSFLVGTAANERALARARGISRYRLRELLTDLVGRLATELDVVQSDKENDREVAVALWRDGRDVQDAAATLGLSVSEVHAARKRNVSHLLDAFHEATPKTFKSPPMFKSELPSEPSALQLFKRALASDRDPSLLEQVRARAADIVAALDEDSAEDAVADVDLPTLDPQWLAELYDALAIPESPEMIEAESQVNSAIEIVHAEEDAEIGTAFAALTEGLPKPLIDWDRWFDAPRVPADTLSNVTRRWKDQVIVKAAGRHGEHLLRFGMTAGTIFEVTVGVSLLADRLIGEQTLTRTDKAILAFRASPAFADNNTFEQLLAETRAAPTCPPDAAHSLLNWVAEVARIRPFLFERYVVIGHTAGALLVQADKTLEGAGLVRRWTAVHTVPELPASSIQSELRAKRRL